LLVNYKHLHKILPKKQTYLSFCCLRYSRGLQPSRSRTYFPKKLVLGKPNKLLISFTLISVVRR